MSVLWWFLVALHLSLLQGYAVSVGVPVVDAGAVLALFLAFYARVAILPALLIVGGIGQAVLMAGGPGLHVLALGIPVAVLLPMRVVFFRGQWLWQIVAAGFLVMAVPRVGGLLSTVLQQPIPQPQLVWWHVAAAALVVPLLVAAMLRLPPLRACVEGRE